MIRLTKYLANNSIASRRKAEHLILNGHVTVDGNIITSPQFLVSKNNLILVDGKEIAKTPLLYYLINKPSGYLSTYTTGVRKKYVNDLLRIDDKEFLVYPIGRLESTASGILLLTNDGELTKALTDKKNTLEIEYLVRVKGIMVRKTIQSIRNNGVKISGSFIKPLAIKIDELDTDYQTTLVRVIFNNPNNKDVRDFFKAIGHEIIKITRIRFDFLTLDVKRGDYRKLKPHEIKKLYRHVRL